MLVWCLGRFPGVQETPFEIVSISQASDIIVMSFSMYIITVADLDTVTEQLWQKTKVALPVKL